MGGGPGARSQYYRLERAGSRTALSRGSRRPLGQDVWAEMLETQGARRHEPCKCLNPQLLEGVENAGACAVRGTGIGSRAAPLLLCADEAAERLRGRRAEMVPEQGKLGYAGLGAYN